MGMGMGMGTGMSLIVCIEVSDLEGRQGPKKFLSFPGPRLPWPKQRFLMLKQNSLDRNDRLNPWNATFAALETVVECFFFFSTYVVKFNRSFFSSFFPKYLLPDQRTAHRTEQIVTLY